VLSVGMLPAYNPQPVYRVPIGADGFVSVPAPNLSPCVTDRAGIFVTGTAMGPMDIVDSIQTASAAAAEAAAYLHARSNGRGEPALEAERMEPVYA
jgi:heterodisulfide reductase subunit A